MEELDFLLENTDMDLLDIVDITESEIIQEDSGIINRSRLKDEAYVKRQIRTIKNGQTPITVKEALVLLGSVFAVFAVTYNPILVALTSVILTRFIAGGFAGDPKVEEKAKDRMLDSIDSMIKKVENAKPKDEEHKKKLETELEKLKKNRELVEKKLK